MNSKIKLSAKMVGGALAVLLAGGCGMGKDLSDGLATPSTNYAQSEAVFKEVSYGEAVGTVVTPNFRSATSQFLDLMGITLAQANAVRGVLGSAQGNLPEIGVSSNMGANQVFAYTKIYNAACNDKCRLDRAGTTPAGERACVFNFGQAYNSAGNLAAWDASMSKLSELLWGRTEITAGEKAALDTLRNEVAGVAAGKGLNVADTTTAAFQAVCVAMALAPAHIVQ